MKIKTLWNNKKETLRSSLWILFLLAKYTFQTYGMLMITLFGFYFFEYIDLNDELLVISHVCLFGSLLCAILLVMHKTLVEEEIPAEEQSWYQG